MQFNIAVITCNKNDTSTTCPMHTLYRQKVRTGQIKETTDPVDFTPAQKKQFAMECIRCTESTVTATSPGARRTVHGFRHVGETLDV